MFSRKRGTVLVLQLEQQEDVKFLYLVFGHHMFDILMIFSGIYWIFGIPFLS